MSCLGIDPAPILSMWSPLFWFLCEVGVSVGVSLYLGEAIPCTCLIVCGELLGIVQSLLGMGPHLVYKGTTAWGQVMHIPTKSGDPTIQNL